jgi:hypothetical protein
MVSRPARTSSGGDPGKGGARTRRRGCNPSRSWSELRLESSGARMAVTFTRGAPIDGTPRLVRPPVPEWCRCRSPVDGGAVRQESREIGLGWCSFVAGILAVTLGGGVLLGKTCARVAAERERQAAETRAAPAKEVQTPLDTAVVPEEVQARADTAVAPMTVDFTEAQICRAAIGALMMRDPGMISAREAGDLIMLSYVREDDATTWGWKCRVEGRRIQWGSDTGRWRTHPLDEKIFYEVDASGALNVEVRYSDGSATHERYDPEELGVRSSE